MGRCQREAAERIFTNEGYGLYSSNHVCSGEKKADLHWLIQRVGQALEDEDNDIVALELADLLYFFVIPFYKEYILREHHLYECIDDLLVRLASWAHSDIHTGRCDVRDDLFV
ncbi:hypothetical protein ACEQPO_04220 [Bacillus sp. SL00103]